MVTICNVEIRNFCKFFCYCFNHFIVIDNPEMMSESILCHKIIFRFTGCYFLDYFLKFFIVRKSEENRFNIGIVYSHMLHTVFFFVAACKLMFLNLTGHIIFHVCCNHDSVLSSAVHSLSINVVMLFFVLNEPSFLLEHIKVFYSFNIYLGVMFICARLKINFRFDDVI